MEINGLQVLASIINFIILFAILKHYFFDKVKETIDNRRNDIENTMSRADEDAEKARRFMLENERILKGAKDEGKRITEAQKQKADKVYSEIVDEASKEAATIVERARVEINREKVKAEHEIKEQAVQLALLLSAKALEEDIDEAKHRALIDDFITKVGI